MRIPRELLSCKNNQTIQVKSWFGICFYCSEVRNSLLFLSILFLLSHESRGQVQYGLQGLVWEDDRYNQEPLKINYSVPVSNLPVSISLKPYCPRVVNQAGTNTAVSWAAVWYARTILESVACDRKDVKANTLEAFNNFFNNRLVTSNCAKPVSLINVLKTLQLDGAMKFTELKTFCLDTIPPEVLESAKQHRISGYVRLFNTFDSREVKVNAMKVALANKNPVVLGVISSNSLGKAIDYWQPKEAVERGTGGHALCVIGYDDNKFGGAFEVVNSWGKDWGKEGFSWIRYEEVKDFVMYGFEPFDAQYSSCLPKNASAGLRFVKTDGTEMKALSVKPGTYKLEKAYLTKTEFRVVVNTTLKMYMYGIFADPTNSISSFFPWPGQNFTNAIPSSKFEFELPLGNFPFTLEPPEGANYLAFIFTSEPLDVAASLKLLQEAPGDFQQRLKSVFKNRSYGQSIQWQSEMKFNVDYDEDMFAVMVVRLDQTER